nr:unnamed protein product [Callosobruchus analis]
MDATMLSSNSCRFLLLCNKELTISLEANSKSSDVLASFSAFLLALLKEAATPWGDLGFTPPTRRIDENKVVTFSRLPKYEYKFEVWWVRSPTSDPGMGVSNRPPTKRSMSLGSLYKYFRALMYSSLIPLFFISSNVILALAVVLVQCCTTCDILPFQLSPDKMEKSKIIRRKSECFGSVSRIHFEMGHKKMKLSRDELLQRNREAERLRYERRKNNLQQREEMREKERLKYQRKKKRA